MSAPVCLKDKDVCTCVCMLLCDCSSQPAEVEVCFWGSCRLSASLHPYYQQHSLGWVLRGVGVLAFEATSLRRKWYRALDGLLITSTGNDWCVCLLTVETHFSLSSPLFVLFYPFVSLSLLISHHFLFRFSYTSSKSNPNLRLLFLFCLSSFLPPSIPGSLACGGLWVNSRFFISLLWLGGKRACEPLWEMSVSVCWESQGPFTSHQTRCHMEAVKWRLTGHSIEPNHLYQMWQQGKEDVW